MRILVTGIAGFIGSTTAHMLIEQGHDVVGIDDLSTGQMSNVPLGIQFIKADVGNPDVFQQIGKIDSCLHFAGFIDSAISMSDPIMYYENNVIATLSLIQNLHSHGVTKFVFSSSASVYGDLNKATISELDQARPKSVYGHTKLIIDQTLENLSISGIMRSASLRYFNATGSYNRIPENHKKESHLIPRAIDAALGKIKDFTIFGNDYETLDGTCIRDYVHVEDLATAHIGASDYLDVSDRLCANLGMGKGFSNLDIVKFVENCMGKEVPFNFSKRRDGDPSVLVANVSHAMETMGWYARKTIEDCIADSVLSRISTS